MDNMIEFITKKKNLIIVLFIIIAAISIYFGNRVNINYEITNYFKDNETILGKNILNEEFEENKKTTLRIMFQNITGHEETILKELNNIKGVYSVDYDDTNKYNSNGYTLYVLNVIDEPEGVISDEVYNSVINNFKDYKYSLDGPINKEHEHILSNGLLLIAIIFIFMMAVIMAKSYIEPFLFLFTATIAILINRGTNIIFGNISNITDSLCLIIQLSLVIEYSILLSNRYHKEMLQTNRESALKIATYNTVKTYLFNSITIIISLISLLFMSFSIGKEMTFVILKSIIISLICIFTIMPSLTLIFDKQINNTRKHTIRFNLIKLGKNSYNLRYGIFILVIIIFCVGYIFKDNIQITYSNETNEISKIFPKTNKLEIIYNNKDSSKMAEICQNITGKNIVNVLCYENTINEKVTSSNMQNKLTNTTLDKDLIKLVYYNYYNSNYVPEITLNELSDFIESKNLDLKNEFSKIKYYTDSFEFNKPRTNQELATILNVNENRIKNFQLNRISLSIKDFLKSSLNSSLPEDTRNTLDNLTFSNIQYNIDTMSKILHINKESMNNLYLSYYSINNLDTTLTMQEFSNYVLNNSNITSMFTEEKIAKIKNINLFTNQELVNKKMSSQELTSLFNLDKDSVDKILRETLENDINNNKTTLENAICYLISIKDPHIQNINNVLEIYTIIKDIPNEKLDQNTWSSIFDNLDSNLISKVYQLNTNPTLTIQELCDFIIKDLATIISENTYQAIVTLKKLVENQPNLVLTNIEQIEELLNLNEEDTYYLISNYYKISPKDFVTYIINNKSNVSKELVDVYKLISNPNYKFNHQEMAAYLNINDNTIKYIYALNSYYNKTLNISELVNFAATEKDIHLDQDTLDKIIYYHNILINLNNNTKYNYIDMSNILGINNSITMDVYNQYTNNYSLKEINNVLIHNKSINNIINSSINNIKYTPEEAYDVLSPLIDIEQNKLSITYLYYASNMFYDNNYKLTIEEFINHLEKSDFIKLIKSPDKDNIFLLKREIEEIKEKLIGNDYSRVIIDTTYPIESEETFNFLEKIENEIGNNTYLVGDILLPYNLHKTFSKDINIIFIMNVILLYLFLLIIFKSLVIPLIIIIFSNFLLSLSLSFLLLLTNNISFISIFIMQLISLTIIVNYIIYLTANYTEFRTTYNKKGAIINTYKHTTRTILISSSILIFLTLITGIKSIVLFNAFIIIFCSIIIIYFTLPAILATLDKIIIKKD